MPKSSHKVYFHSLKKAPFLKDRTTLKLLIEKIFNTEKRKLQEIHYIFCSDGFLLKINQQYLHHNDYTDIITFDLSESTDIFGEVYISVERVRKNAKAFKFSYSDEMLRVLIHGTLHLCGYNDKTGKERIVMREKEDFYINEYK